MTEAEKERAAIVAWLRGQARNRDGSVNAWLHNAAVDLENRRHLQPPSE